MVPAGWVSDRFGPRSTMTVAMIGGASVTAIMGITPGTGSLAFVIFLRFLFGIFSAPLFPSAGALTVGWFRRQAYGRVQGIVAGATGGGATVAPVIIATIVTTNGWRTSYLQTAAITMLVGVLWHWRVRNGVSHKKQIDDNESGMKDLLRNRTLWLLTLSYAAVSFLSALFDNWIYYYFREVRHYAPASSAWFATATQTSILLGLPIGGWLTDRLETLRRKRLFVFSMLSVSATSLAFASVSGDYTIALILFCVAYGVSSVTDACFSATSLEIGGSIPGSSYGFLNTGFAGGSLIGSVSIPAIAGVAGWNIALYATSAVVLAGAALWLLISCPVLLPADVAER